MRGTGRKFAVVTVASIVALVTAQARAIEYGNIQVIQNDAANSTTSVNVTTTQATSGFLIRAGSNRGDYNIQIGASSTDDAAGGVLISSVRENGRDNTAAGETTLSGTRYVTVANERSGGSLFIALFEAPSGSEFNTNLSSAYFNFSEGWLGGYAYNSVNNGEFTSLVASPGLALGTHVIDEVAGSPEVGRTTVDLRSLGIDSRSSGVLLVNGAKNEDNFSLSRVNTNGTWTIITTDNGDDGSDGIVGENDPTSFVFVPFGTPGATSGRITSQGGIWNADEGVSVQAISAGQVRLTIAGQTPTSGALIVSAEGGDGNNIDNVVTYQADGDGWIIQTRDIGGLGLQELNFGEAMANFTFLPFATQVTTPGSRAAIDVNGIVSAGNVLVTEFNGGNAPGDMAAVVTESTGRVFVNVANRGDNGIAIDGVRIDATTGVLLATAREDFRNNGATGGVSGVAVVTPYVNATAGWTISTQGADSTNPGEMNVNFAVAYFPYAAGWQAEANVATTGGIATVSLAGVNSFTDGLLFVNAFGNDDNYATVAPNVSGGWDVQVRDNGGGLETDNGGNNFSYVYIPRTTPNLIAGVVDSSGNILDSTGLFSLAALGNGQYGLTIDGQSDLTGMLLLNALIAGNSADNILTYFHDGSQFVISGYDTGTGPATRQVTDFQFAFIPFSDSANAAIPEPTSLALVGIGMFGLLGRRRKSM